MTSLSEHTLESLAETLTRHGLPTSHARRLLAAHYRGAGEVDLDALDVGKGVRALFDAEISKSSASIAARRQSADGTVKLLLALDGGGSVESVLMPAFRGDRAAACVSSQVGCAMRCDFCASTRAGLERDLAAGEIVEQYVRLGREARAAGRRISTLVFMGMGEPMHNLPNVLGAIERIAGLGGLGWRNITVSTVGVVPGIHALAEADRGVSLAISLHAPDDATRTRLVPMNRKWRVADVMEAARSYYDRTGRIVTIEYCLLEGINDSDEQAHLLAGLLAGFRAHVNLIPYNSIGAGISGTVYRRPGQQRMLAFADILMAAGVATHFRRTRGDDVDAACGQLRQSAMALPVLTA